MLITDLKVSKIDIAEQVLKQCCEEGTLDLFKRMKHGMALELSKIHKIPGNIFSQAKERLANEVRLEQARHPFNNHILRVQSSKRRELNLNLLEQDQIRKAPRAELVACNTMNHALIYRLPPGGVVLLTGTPAPFSACPTNYNLTSDDNLSVAHHADSTSEHRGEIIVGNAVDNQKALDKAREFNGLATIHNAFDVFIGRIDRYTLEFHIKRLLKKFDLVKVILMGGGNWVGNTKIMKDYNLDVNFSAPCRELVQKHSNLHILAMTMGQATNNTETRRSYTFAIKYLHDGKEETLEPIRKK